MRRKSPRVVWLPQDNLNSIPANGTSAYQRFTIDIFGPPGSFAVGEIPLVIDQPQDPLINTTTLSDIGNSGYRLRRIVGKIWCNVVQQALDSPGRIIVTAGLIVRRVDEGGSSLAFLTGNATTASPSEIVNTEDPWIWRRSWLLANSLSTNLQAGVLGIPTQNWGGQAGSALDGPHVDQKTARVIGPEERLFLDASVLVIDGGGIDQITTVVQFHTDLRVLGSLRTTSGNRRNASR